MSGLTDHTRWWGWGGESGRAHLPEHAGELLRTEIGLSPPAARERVGPPGLEDVRLPEGRLPGRLRERLHAVLDAEHVREDRLARVSRAAGKSYPDLLRLRAGDAPEAPDAVLEPGSREEVAEALRACAEAGVAVVPFGGGTSVVGGVTPAREGFEAAVTIDLGRLDHVHPLDRRSLSAVLGAGAVGARVEAALAAQGLTLGHFPQSFELATIGGFVATRSAGQASTGYGRIEDNVLGLRMATPAGELTSRATPASAAGPSLRELVVGSEGTLGVLTDVTVALRPAPAVRRYEGWSFRSFAEGVEAFRTLAQADAAPDVARLSDEQESRLSLALASTGTLGDRAGRAYLRARGHGTGALAILGFEGESRLVARRQARTARLMRSAGAVGLGEGPGRAWARSRYAAPYLRDELMDAGALVDTLETATSWSDLLELHHAVADAVRDALAARGTPPLVGCHVSHLYGTGASLYFTVLARAEEGAELEQWRAAKRAASEAIASRRATITHHHAVGADHRPWIEREVGGLGVEVLRAAKERLDPAGVMNPGKLLPSGPR